MVIQLWWCCGRESVSWFGGLVWECRCLNAGAWLEVGRLSFGVSGVAHRFDRRRYAFTFTKQNAKNEDQYAGHGVLLLVYQSSKFC